jgi:hypothetical protein
LPRGAIAAIGLEPSGGYERDVVRILLAAGFSVRRINPNKLRQFARAAGALAKNDRIDARLIADYITVMPTRVVERNPAIERLAETVTMRRQLCDEQIAVEINAKSNKSKFQHPSQASHLEDALLQRIAKRRLTRIKATSFCLTSVWPSWLQPSQTSSNASVCCARCPASAPRSPIPCWPCCPNSGRSAASRLPHWSAWHRTHSIAAGSAGSATSMEVA